MKDFNERMLREAESDLRAAERRYQDAALELKKASRYLLHKQEVYHTLKDAADRAAGEPT
ncbi:hypothetical protein [Pararobbsia silviterrae]|uniref:Uncharacterized protein n=1 Tax=Pararobbsia silviterrae TaxID=1792498 RepID=A0A494X959_9BURK|nr:hypothetical protein [Pararobbsia silviterrae]RKP44724.1 hypothetical protein D7S86_27260 [Pararobbsia silviterrae]